MTEPPCSVQSCIDLIILIASSLLGAWVTWQFRIEMTGVRIGR